MKCLKCRHINPDHANFCQACGYACVNSFLCEHCSAPLAAALQTCPTCGQDRTTFDASDAAPPNQPARRTGISPLTAGALAGIGGYILGSSFARTAASGTGNMAASDDGDFFGLDLNGDGATDAIMANVLGGPGLDTIVADLNFDGIADAVGMDLNDDGILDAIGLDENQDGVLEAVGVDTDADGTVDLAGFDSDGDGHFDLLSGDSDMDGQTDWVAWDSDGDGTFDMVAADLDGDGLIGEGELSDIDADVDLGADFDADLGDVDFDAADFGGDDFGDVDFDF
jgi:hypothetical protein